MGRSNRCRGEGASSPPNRFPGLVRKYTIVTGGGMLAQIIMVVLEGPRDGLGPGCTRPGLCLDHHVGQYINLAFGNLFGTGVPAVVGNLWVPATSGRKQGPSEVLAHRDRECAACCGDGRVYRAHLRILRRHA